VCAGRGQSSCGGGRSGRQSSRRGRLHGAGTWAQRHSLSMSLRASGILSLSLNLRLRPTPNKRTRMRTSCTPTLGLPLHKRTASLALKLLLLPLPNQWHWLLSGLVFVASPRASTATTALTLFGSRSCCTRIYLCGYSSRGGWCRRVMVRGEGEERGRGRKTDRHGVCLDSVYLLDLLLVLIILLAMRLPLPTRLLAAAASSAVASVLQTQQQYQHQHLTLTPTPTPPSAPSSSATSSRTLQRSPTLSATRRSAPTASRSGEPGAEMREERSRVRWTGR
jgi:hypothetical protein